MPTLQAVKNLRYWIFDEMDTAVEGYGGHRMTWDGMQGSFQLKKK